MSAIITITPNPCIDKSTIIDGLVPDKKLRCSLPVFEPGGGGINVSRAIQKLGGSSTAIFPAGGHTGSFLVELLNKERIPIRVINTKSFTRENLTVADTQTNSQYRFVMPGPALREHEWQECLHRIQEADHPAFIVASGSLPPGVPEDFFGKVAEIAKSKKAKCILDTSGEAVKYTLNKGVYLWKPNIGELSAISGQGELTFESAVSVARKIISEKKCEVIVMSMGAVGAVLITKDSTEQFRPPPVFRKSTVGAGDSMVAGIVLCLSKNKPLPEAVKYGVASGTAATMNPGTELCKQPDVDAVLKMM